MKKLLLLLITISMISLGLLAQNSQRRQGSRAERIRDARQNKTEALNNNSTTVVGKNRFTTQVNGDSREYYVHVPKTYSKDTPIPVVFMLHGTSGDGEKFYNLSGWKEVGETDNVLTVFPSSWRHCVIDQGVQKNTTKWNIFPGSFEYCAGEKPKDDIKFLNQVIDELCAKFNLNQKMIYMVGFSNGGQMTARVGVEMSDRIAAVVSSAGFLKPKDSYTAKRLLPNLIQVGTNDDRYTLAFGGAPAPMNFDQLFSVSPYMKGVMATYAKIYKLDSHYATGGNASRVTWLDAKGTSGNPNNVFRFALINKMFHVYPNGDNFWLEGAQVNWKWLKQYKLP